MEQVAVITVAAVEAPVISPATEVVAHRMLDEEGTLLDIA